VADDPGDGEEKVARGTQNGEPSSECIRDNITYSVIPSCRTLSLFLIPLTLNFDGSGISDVDTKHGPVGHAPSKPLLKHHWLVSSCVSLWLTSLHAVYPRTYSSAVSSETFLHVRPMTTASSDS